MFRDRLEVKDDLNVGDIIVAKDGSLVKPLEKGARTVWCTDVTYSDDKGDFVDCGQPYIRSYSDFVGEEVLV